jgi:hypothetical protein
MKKQINPTIKAHLIRGAFYLLLLLAVWAIPFALAQRNVKRSASSPAAAAKAALAAAEVQRNPDTANQAQVPLRNPALHGTAFTNAYGVASLFGHHTAIGKHASVIGNNPLLTYVIDDGTAEDSVGLTAGGSFVAVNSFPVDIRGNNVITSISIAWGHSALPRSQSGWSDLHCGIVERSEWRRFTH